MFGFEKATVRVRLTVWYSVALSLAMALLAVTMYVAMLSSLEAEFDDDLEHDTEALAGRLIHELREGEPPWEAASSLGATFPFHNIAVEVFAEGRLVGPQYEISRDGLMSREELERVPAPGEGVVRLERRTTEAYPAGADIAMISVIGPIDNRVYTIVAAADRKVIASPLGTMRRLALVAIPFLVMLAVTGGWILARRALEPIAAMVEQARQIGTDHLSDRLAVPNPNDELGRLAQTFNEMLDRIEQAFDRMRQFVADASHELRSPVSVIRSGTEVALTEPVTLDECHAVLEAIRDQTERLSRIVDDLFLLTRADAGDPDVLSEEVVPICEVVASCVQTATALGQEHGVELRFLRRPRVEPFCRGDRARLEQMFMNLLENAVRFAGDGGEVDVEIDLEGEREPRVAIAISDTGPGISEEHREAVFERFVRLDAARSRHTGGAGLGLPIARWIATSHGGSLDLTDAAIGGCRFTVRLPVETIETREFDATLPAHLSVD